MKPRRCNVDKFYKVLNVSNDSLIVMCMVLEGLLTDYMAKEGLAANRRLYRRLGFATRRLYKETMEE